MFSRTSFITFSQVVSVLWCWRYDDWSSGCNEIIVMWLCVCWKTTFSVSLEKPLKRDWLARVCFSLTIFLIFGGRCNRFFWEIRLKIYRWLNFNNNALSLPANRIFQKQTVFVFTESLSRDQLLQKAYCVPAANTSVHVQGKRKYVPWSTTSWKPFSRLSYEQSNRRWALDAWKFHFILGLNSFKNVMQNPFSLSEKGSEKHFTPKNATVFKCIYSE